MRNRLVVGILTVVMLACTGTKKTQTTVTKNNNEPAINLDTIKVVANPEPKKKIYRGSNPLTNDIINTKLEVSFDWENSHLIGKAEIHAKPYFYPTNMLYLDARGMEIKSVKVDEVFFANEHNVAVESRKQMPSTSYTYENDSLKINLGKVFTAKEDYFVTIEYIAHFLLNTDRTLF